MKRLKKAKDEIETWIWEMRQKREIKRREEKEKLKEQLLVLRQVNEKLVQKELQRLEEHNKLVERLSEANKEIAELRTENKIAYESALKRTQEMVELKNELLFLREEAKKQK